MDDFIAFLKGVNLGTLPGWIQVGLWLAILWKGVPAFLDSITNRQKGIEERMGTLLDQATARFDKQIAAADKRHDECIQGQERLQARVDTLEDEVSKLQSENIGLRRQIGGLQVDTGKVLRLAAGADETATSMERVAAKAIETKGTVG